MATNHLAAAVCVPDFDVSRPVDGGPFAYSSHRRAAEALEFGLKIDKPGFNIFVVGEDNSGRMTASLAFFESAVKDRPRPDDWVYLNNFRRPNRPRPYRLPAGVGRTLRERMGLLVPRLRESLSEAFAKDDYRDLVRSRGETVGQEVNSRIQALREEAQAKGLDLVQTPQGTAVAVRDEKGEPASLDSVPEARRAEVAAAGKEIADKLQEINRFAAKRQIAFGEWVAEQNRLVADQAVGSLIAEIAAEFAGYRGLTRWFVELRTDVVDNFMRFKPPEEGEARAPLDIPERRYAVNLLVDHSDDPQPNVVLEPNPTYQNLFGRIEYRQHGNTLETDFTMIKAGALHRANGGLLVLRAEALAANGQSWTFLKGALRDSRIRLEEPYRTGAVPTAGTPSPETIPLEVKVVIVGAPRWYYTFFSADPEFQNYFKVKADIDADMEASEDNVALYAGHVQAMARARAATCEDGAIRQLLGAAARIAGRRDRLTARFERIEDILLEALTLAQTNGDGAVITAAAVVRAQAERRHRNARIEDRVHEAIHSGTVMIDTRGAVIGQINGLTVRDAGDHAFGAPARITARASIGRLGVINVERDAALGGPIQQKGAMVIQGFLAGHFARRIPLSFNCSITFEQSYGGVEGDSASLAELVAVLSDLAGAPLRQDLAITGSVNQRGQAQAIGGVHHKVEGFFRACREAGDLTGTQGVAIPASNAPNLVLEAEVARAVADGRFHVYTVETVDDALELFTGVDCGAPDAAGVYPPETLYGRVQAQLEAFDRALAERDRAPGGA
jgi:predicted ATP-dependent protease